MMRVVTQALRVVLTGIALVGFASAAEAAAHVAAPALHTEARAHHRLHHHAVRGHVAHAASFRDAPAAFPHSRHGRAPSHQHNRKAALPASFHLHRQGSGPQARHGAAAFSTVALSAHDAGLERMPGNLHVDYCPGTSLTLAGRAPPRAGPSTNLAPAYLPRRLATPRRADPAPISGAPIRFLFRFEPDPTATRAPLCARPSAFTPVAKLDPTLPVSSEQPLGRSRSVRPEGATARRTMPSTRGLS